jgi:hypothetical protein
MRRVQWLRAAKMPRAETCLKAFFAGTADLFGLVGAYALQLEHHLLSKHEPNGATATTA